MDTLKSKLLKILVSITLVQVLLGFFIGLGLFLAFGISITSFFTFIMLIGIQVILVIAIGWIIIMIKTGFKSL
jgi:hypothetical protein